MIRDQIERLNRLVACGQEPQCSDPLVMTLFLAQPHIIKDQKLRVREAERRLILCLGLPISLTPMAYQALITIAERGQAGVTQADLARLMNQDSRNLHHHLAALLRHRLIHRTPVANRKSFTHLLVWSGFHADGHAHVHADGQAHSQADGHSQSSRGAKEQILALVGERGPMAIDALLAFLAKEDEDGKRRRMLRRAISDLVQEGRLQEEGNLLSLGGEQPPASLAVSSPKCLPSLAYSLGIPLERQVVEAIRATGPNGCTLPRLAQLFGFGRKLVYRLYTRLTAEPSRYLILDEAGLPVTVEKITEFEGKERRHRLFLKGEQQQQPNRMESPLEITSSPFGFARDSITRLQRQEAIMRLLLPANLYDVGRTLAQQLQKEMNLPHLPDSKTLKRTLLAMEEAGMVRCVHVPVGVSGGTRALVMPATLSLDDPRVQAYVQQMRDSYVIIPDDDQDEQVRKGPAAEGKVSEGTRVKKMPVEKMGFVAGVGKRAMILHGHLLQTCGSDWQLETSRHLFHELPVELFLKLIGLAESSLPLHQHLLQHPEQRLCDLPPPLLRELQQRRSFRHRNLMRQLLELLVDLGLLQVSPGYPAVAYKLPYLYKVCREVEFNNRRFVFPLDWEAYWLELEQIAKQSAEGKVGKVPPLLAAPDSWIVSSRPVGAQDPPALVKELTAHVHTDLSAEQIATLAAEHEVSLEQVQQILQRLREQSEARRVERSRQRAAKYRETMRRKRQAQEEARRLAGEEPRRRRRREGVEEVGEGESAMVGDAVGQWSAELRRRAVMAFCWLREGGGHALAWAQVEPLLGLAPGEGRRGFIRHCLSRQSDMLEAMHTEQQYHLLRPQVSRLEELLEANLETATASLRLESQTNEPLWSPARLIRDECDRVRQSRASLAEHRLHHWPGYLSTVNGTMNAAAEGLGVERVKAVLLGEHGGKAASPFEAKAVAWLQEQGLVAPDPNPTPLLRPAWQGFVATERLQRGVAGREEVGELEQLAFNLFMPLPPIGGKREFAFKNGRIGVYRSCPSRLVPTWPASQCQDCG